MFKWVLLLCAVAGFILRGYEDSINQAVYEKRHRDLEREDYEFNEWLLYEADDDEW